MSVASHARPGRALSADLTTAPGSAGRKPRGRHFALVRELQASNDRLQQMLADQTRFGHRAGALIDAGRELIATLDADRIHHVAVETIEQSLDLSAGAFTLFDDVNRTWTTRAPGTRSARWPALPLAFCSSMTPFSDSVRRGRVYRKPRIRAGSAGFDGALAAVGFKSYVALPVARGQERPAALLAVWADEYVPLPEELWFLESLSILVALGLHNAALYAELEGSVEALRQAQARADHANRLQALGQVASGVAHDFNNSLTTILGLSDWLLHELPSDTSLYADLDTIRTAAQDAAAMVRRLQTFTRFKSETGPPETGEPVELAALAYAVGDLARPRCQELAARTGHQYAVAVEPAQHPIVTGSAPEIRELLVNLVFNALDAMPSGGTVRVLTRVRDGRPEVAVVDTGIGMSPDIQARIFEPFFSTKGHKGTGLGLSVCATIAERHGATLTVESEPGAGTTFVLAFPSAAGAPEGAGSRSGLRLVHVSEAAP